MGLRWWKVTLTIVRDPEELARNFYRENETIYARTYSDWRYLTARVSINYPVVKRMPEDELERLIVHELSHVLLDEMRNGSLEHEERVATSITNALLWTAVDIENKEKELWKG